MRGPVARARGFVIGLGIGLGALSSTWSWEGAARGDTRDVCNSAAEEAQRLRHEGKLREARVQFVACVRNECPAIVRNDCTKWLADLDTAIPSVVIRAVDGSGADVTQATVSVDGEPLTTSLDGKEIPMDPGLHAFRFERAGAAAVEQRMVIREGEKHRIISITFAPSPPEPPTRGEDASQAGTVAGEGRRSIALPLVLLGAGAVGLGVAAYFWTSGLQERSTLQSTCYSHCTDAQVDAARTKLVVGDVVAAVGIASAVVGGGILVWGRPSATVTTASLTAVPTPGGAAVGLQGRF
jgi:hypothetical protein